MTEHPAAPTPPAERTIEWMRRRAENGADLVYALQQLEQVEAEARAAACKEVADQLRPALEEAHRYAGASYFAGAAVRKVIRILDSLSTDTREEPRSE